MAEEENTYGEEVVKGRRNVLRYFSVIFLIIAIIVLFILWLTVDRFTGGWLIIIIIFVVILSLVGFFATNIPGWIAGTGISKEGLKIKITREECRKLAEAMVEDDYYNEMGKIEDDGTEQRGKSGDQLIYFNECKGKFPHADGKIPVFFIGINMHFPKENKRIVVNPSKADKEKVKRRLVRGTQEDLPDEESRVETDLSSGKKVEYKKKTRRQTPKKKEVSEL